MTKYEELQEYLKLNQYTWLVTGVAGFIGSNLLEKLLILNQRVVGLDNFDTGYQRNIDQAIMDAEEVTGNTLTANFTFINGVSKIMSRSILNIFYFYFFSNFQRFSFCYF